jgi:hypothetical protein
MKLADPKVEELVQDGKLRSEVVLLPDEGLQKRGWSGIRYRMLAVVKP